ncbi:MAG: Dabb family protein [Bacteroidota bacterium]
MLRHIVMIKIKKKQDNQVVTEKLRIMLQGLEQSIKWLCKIEVGINISTKASAYDVVLTADFDDVAGLDEYRVHPEHVKVLDYLKIVMDKATVVDYYN